MMHIELIDIDNSEIIDDFPSEAEAFRRLAELAVQFGWSTFDDLSLVRVDDQGRSLIAAELQLAELVRHNSTVVAGSNPGH
jgi:hypothetical protein